MFADKHPALPYIQIASLSPSSIVSLEPSQAEWMAGGRERAVGQHGGRQVSPRRRVVS